MRPKYRIIKVWKYGRWAYRCQQRFLWFFWLAPVHLMEPCVPFDFDTQREAENCVRGWLKSEAKQREPNRVVKEFE